MVNEWPRQIGAHSVTADRECEHCGASHDSLAGFHTIACDP
jgi:hypothetical protein